MNPDIINRFVDELLDKLLENPIDEKCLDTDTFMKNEFRKCLPTQKLQREFDRLTHNSCDPSKLQAVLDRLLMKHYESQGPLFLALKEAGLIKSIIQVDPHYTEDFLKVQAYCTAHKLKFDSFLAALLRNIPTEAFLERFGHEVEYD